MTARPAPATALQGLAEAMGVLPRWQDLSGREQVTGPETQRALLHAMGLSAATEAEADETLAALGARRAARLLPEELVLKAGAQVQIPLASPAAWRLEIEDGKVMEGRPEEDIVLAPPPGLHRLEVADQTCLIIAAPPHTPSPEDKLAGRELTHRAWGVSAALYGLRSDRNLGLGDYRDLGEAAARLAKLGADFIGINPVHARGAAAPGISPYSPSCRTALEPRHIALDAVPGFDGCRAAQRLLGENARRLTAARASDRVDYRFHEEVHSQILLALFDHFEATQESAAAEFAIWRRHDGAALEWFALYEALSLRHGPDWRDWPPDLQTISNRATQDFAGDQAGALRYHAWLQWLAERQLAGAQTTAKEAGMALGLYLDLAVGARPGGADRWFAPACFAEGVSLGAPPDAFNPAGQNWSLAPFNPIGLRRAAYRPFIEMLRKAMRHAGIIRIDHILGINRSFWVPGDGTPGGYVSYPMEALLALIRIEAQRSGCVVVGEDLGSVPDGLRARLAEAGLLGCAVMQFEKDGAGFRHPADYRAATLASFATHDTPTLRGWWAGWDIALRHDLGQTGAETTKEAKQQRQAERTAMGRLLVQEALAPADFDAESPPPDADDDLAKGLHALLARSPSPLLAVQLDDALGMVEQQNLPGTVDEYPNWRRRYAISVADLDGDPGLGTIACVMKAAARPPSAKKEKQQWL